MVGGTAQHCSRPQSTVPHRPRHARGEIGAGGSRVARNRFVFADSARAFGAPRNSMRIGGIRATGSRSAPISMAGGDPPPGGNSAVWLCTVQGMATTARPRTHRSLRIPAMRIRNLPVQRSPLIPRIRRGRLGGFGPAGRLSGRDRRAGGAGYMRPRPNAPLGATRRPPYSRSRNSLGPGLERADERDPRGASPRSSRSNA